MTNCGIRTSWENKVSLTKIILTCTDKIWLYNAFQLWVRYVIAALLTAIWTPPGAISHTAKNTVVAKDGWEKKKEKKKKLPQGIYLFGTTVKETTPRTPLIALAGIAIFMSVTCPQQLPGNHKKINCANAAKIFHLSLLAEHFSGSNLKQVAAKNT